MDNREIDVLIAEKVMGWVDIENDFDDGTIWGVSPESVATEVYKTASPFELVPKYTTDISAAWLVIEKVRLEGNQVQVWGNSSENVWRASLKAEFGRWGEYFTKAESAPMAICLAALKAVGVEIK